MQRRYQRGFFMKCAQAGLPYGQAVALYKRAQEADTERFAKALRGAGNAALNVVKSNPEASGGVGGAALGALLASALAPESKKRGNRLATILLGALAGGGLGVAGTHYAPAVKSLFVKDKAPAASGTAPAGA